MDGLINIATSQRDSFFPSLIPRPFFAGEEKRAWYNLFAHARDSQELGYAWIFSVYLLVVFRYIPAYVQRMMAESDVCECCCL